MIVAKTILEGDVIVRRKKFLTISGGFVEVAFEPLDVGTAGGFPGGTIPAGGRALFHSLAIGGGEENEFLAALGTILVELLGCAVDPFDVVTTSGFLGLFVPAAGTALLHFLAKAGDLKNQWLTAFGTFLIQRLGFDCQPFDIVAALVLFRFFVPGTTRTALQFFAGCRFDDITE